MSSLVLIALLAGAAGVAVGWLLGGQRGHRSDAERAMLAERLRGREARIEDLERRLAAREGEVEERRREAAGLGSRAAELTITLDQERQQAAEKLHLLEQAQVKLGDAFRLLSAEALQRNNQSFLDLAKTTLESFQQGARQELDLRRQAIGEMVRPLGESIGKVDQKLLEIEKERVAAYAGMSEQLRGMRESESRLERETGRLVQALRTPAARGRWGEMQLRRVVEMAGMLEHCDFVMQSEIGGEDGRLRPDMVVRLPNGRQLVVDAKAPLEAYLEALDIADEELRRARYAAHAGQIRGHLVKLGEKSYWSQLDGAPDFVVLFLPGEVFFSAALEQDPRLLEFGVEHNVIVATPTTLIAMLKAIHYGWRQERIADKAREISELGRELHDRLRVFATHLESMRRGLDRSVEAFNQAVGSLEGRVLPQARRFRELGATGGEEIPVVQSILRGTRSPELPASDAIGDVPAASKEPEKVEE